METRGCSPITPVFFQGISTLSPVYSTLHIASSHVVEYEHLVPIVENNPDVSGYPNPFRLVCHRMTHSFWCVRACVCVLRLCVRSQ